MSQADLAQLTAQRAQDEYNIVQAESNVKDYKRQLKELLQITSDEAFDINMPNTTDAMALDAIPALNGVYAAALETVRSSRPSRTSWHRTTSPSRLPRRASCLPSAPMRVFLPAALR